ncbi:MAG TPA: SAM-dependent chlorinase/fluorinase [Longimicrobiales bacterium]|nr:SAM-dependent chlorinase/fluorinase [Longimicrobiales bacterium]
MNRALTLLTDFGTRDGYVAAMKGVIASIVPGAALVDVAHDVRPGDVSAAAWTLRRYWRLFPTDTVHLAVVDPGVGTDRRALAARVDGRYFVAPDNGILSWVLHEHELDAAVSLDQPRFRRPHVSPTFHGRDIFAPAAAHLSAGVPLSALGSPLIHPVRLPLPDTIRRGNEVEGLVVQVDRFGNLVTNIPAAWVSPLLEEGPVRTLIGRHDVGTIRRTYGDVAEGEPVALIGSDLTVEVAVREGRASDKLKVGLGAPVIVRRASPD